MVLLALKYLPLVVTHRHRKGE